MDTKKVLSITYKVFGVLYILFGLLTLCASVLVFFGTGLAGYSESLMSQMGEKPANYPYAFAIIGGILTLALSILYFIGAYALLASKKWAFKILIAIASVGLVSGIYTLATGLGFNFMEFFWAAVYGGLAYLAYKNPDLFTK